jgi:hypothetical protein
MDPNGFGRFVAQGNLHAVHAVNRGIACGGSAQQSDESARNEAHVHQVVLDGFRQVKGDQFAALTYV